MTINDLTKEDSEAFKAILAKNEKLNKLQQQFFALRKSGMFVQAIEVGRKIDEMRKEIFTKWITELVNRARVVDLNKSDLPNEVKEKMNILYVTVFMACDIIESGVLDMNDTLHKAAPTFRVELFDDILRLAKKAKEHISQLQRNTSYLNNSFWGERCDDMYEMMQNKAKKLIKYNKNLNGARKQENQECH